MKRFTAKNPWFSYILLGVWLLILWALYAVNLFPLVLAIIFSLLFVIFFPLMPISQANVLINEAVQKLDNECDPYPLLTEVEDQLSYIKGAGNRQTLFINHATALSQIGQYKQAYDRLCSIDINLLSGTLLQEKAVYYSNLSSFSLAVGDYEASLAHHAKASQILALTKSKKFKELLFASLRLTAAEQAIYRKDYDTALSLLATVEDKTKRISVEKAFMYGEILLAQGITEEAKSNFMYVINNGNRLYIAVKAQEILASL